MIKVFSVGVAGNGQMLSPFVEELKERFPQVIVYNRNVEAARVDTGAAMPSIPSVSDFDALFTRAGTKETANIKSFHRHRYFNYDLHDLPPGTAGAKLLLGNMIQAVSLMLTLPEQPVAVGENSGDTETAKDAGLAEQNDAVSATGEADND